MYFLNGTILLIEYLRNTQLNFLVDRHLIVAGQSLMTNDGFS